ncbi:hypothetical protein [Desulfurococcus amylolyticus]|uniref:hypothetical protein n=1 Tax=Desulfurococcus amylolyticus TaxID=94694 RepID=UPI0005B1D477|nr:hypothetical protein [Desulfurococcus amylolyticus]
MGNSIGSDKGVARPGKILYSFIISNPWLYPFIYAIYSTQGASIEELRSIIDLRMQLVKRALWWLVKSGIVEEKGGRFYIRREYMDYVNELKLSTCILKDTYILRVKDAHIVVAVRNGRIIHWAVPSELYDKVVELEKNTNVVFTSGEVSQALAIDIGTATKLVKLRRLIKECWGNPQGISSD